MRNNKLEKKKLVLWVCLFLVLGLGIGYALLTEQLKLNGSINYGAMAFDVGFTTAEDGGGSVTSSPSVSTDKKSVTVTCNLGTSTSSETCIAKAKIKNASSFAVELESDPTISYDNTYINSVTAVWTGNSANVVAGDSIGSNVEEEITITITTKELTEDMLPETSLNIPVTITMDWVENNSSQNVQEELVKTSGKIIRVDDVSETPHNPTITLTSDTITDFSSVSVSRTGKNILDVTRLNVKENVKDFKLVDASRNTIEFTKSNAASTVRSSIGIEMYLTAGTYHTSGNVTTNNETVKRIAAIVITSVNSAEQLAQTRFGEDITPDEYTNSFTITKSGMYTVRICTMFTSPINTTYTISNIQIEYGQSSEFEPYNSQTVLANSNGTVTGINMISPSTTIFSDKDVLIDVEYLSKKLLNNSTTDTPEVSEPTAAISKTVTTVNAGDVISLESNAIKKNKTLTFNANITTFGSIELRHGENDLGASQIVINNTTIEFYNVSSSTTLTPTLTTSFEHGLTISGDTKIVASANNNYTLSVSITSNGKTFTKDGINWTGSNGAIELESTGTTMSNLTLTWDCSDYSDEIWIFGDSFVEINSTERWPYYILPNYDNFLLSGYRGSTSAKMYTDFQAALKHGTPKFAVWILGMNDQDSSTAVNSSWKTNIEKFIATCEAKGITPILSTIPNVPNRINYYKNEYVKNSGYRYIDFATAVGANEIGSSWTEGMLNTDNVHPSATGAQALANQILIDLPELKNE